MSGVARSIQMTRDYFLKEVKLTSHLWSLIGCERKLRHCMEVLRKRTVFFPIEYPACET
jgi:hypothetical protein